jgi:thioredoxin-like negative regulator of GroEL
VTLLQVYTPEEFQQALEAAGPSTLVVVDFFKTACGACKFIYPGFVKMCRESTTQQQQQQQESSQPVVFLKHNV